MGFWDEALGAILGRSPKTVDPYAKDREMRMQAYSRAMGDYDKMMSTPGGAIPPEYRAQMMKETEEGVRNRYAGQGQSGFTGDRISRAQNDLRVKLLDTELGQLNKQRDYMSQLIGMNQPTQELPGETGMLSKAGSDLAGRATRQFGDVILGKEKEEDPYAALSRIFGQYGNNTRGGGMNVGGE